MYIGVGFTTILKFATCLLIATHHYCGAYFIFADEKNAVLRLLVTYGGVVGVNIFFFLSGYGLMKSEQRNHLSFLKFLKKRLWKVYAPAVLAGVVGYLIFYFFYHAKLNLMDVVFNVLILNSDNVFWFLQVLVGLYFAFCISTLIGEKNKMLGAMTMISLTAVITAVDWIVDVDYHAINVPAFVVGAAVAKYGATIYQLLHSKTGVALTLVVMAIVVLVSMCSTLWSHAIIPYILLLGILTLCSYVKIDIECSKLIGDMSHDIYLIHNKINHLTTVTSGG